MSMMPAFSAPKNRRVDIKELQRIQILFLSNFLISARCPPLEKLQTCCGRYQGKSRGRDKGGAGFVADPR